ncbi:hypothetical protein [Tenacibaculum jejuense]|uniref:Uncharacterized protein n=1 Tax=Tenacibaculum jejuense TaxID=584609 RepID=A0A238UD21_9FLAO|nr:hypothetical protein [Tenacibaculum jejuense]SNR16916.1 membrane protein of unknown function [Tenacibaculum jejuense]
MQVTKLKDIWKEIVLLSTWIVTVTSAFIIPLPSWNATDENTGSFVKFGVFIATILAGFMILFSLRNKIIKIWMRLSVLFLILFMGSYISYHYLRGSNTLPYLEKDIVVGNELVKNNPFKIFEDTHGFLPDRKERMLILLGDPEKAWTKKSIRWNRIELMISLFLCYLFSAVFMISFSNLILLYKEKYKQSDN